MRWQIEVALASEQRAVLIGRMMAVSGDGDLRMALMMRAA
jgi:hypothetical protein